MQKRLGSPGRTKMDLKPATHHLIHQLEKADEVRLPGPVRPDEDVERTEFDLRVPDRLPPRESQAGQLCHFMSSFWRAHRTRRSKRGMQYCSEQSCMPLFPSARRP